MKRDLLQSIIDAQGEKRPLALAINLATNEQQLIDLLEDTTPPWLVEKALEAARADKSRIVQDDDGNEWFLNIFNTPLRLIIIGAVHIAQPLSQIASQLGYDVTVVDPREAFATESRFPSVSLVTAWPDDALKQLNLDARTAVVALTHDPKLDDPALEIALNSSCFYIGALGSKKTQAARHERLEKAGFDDETRARICGPVGLNIGAKSPAEIAVSILAEITKTLRLAQP
jgi:xanthine dehydrogenase accessory factor